MISRLRCLTVNRTVLQKVGPLKPLSVRSISEVGESKDEQQNDVQINQEDEDMPIEMSSPYLEEKPCCILCKYKIEVNYKNPRLLSQFISSFTGLMYDRNITGLCSKQDLLVRHHIKIARRMQMMPKYYKNPLYQNDRRLFNPFRPLRENNV